MLDELSEQDRAEQEAIIAGIHLAFADVIRGEHGVSWNECLALDRYASDEECAAARRSDADTHWSQLITSPDWHPFPGMGGFSFINFEGFRYYLPPTMVRFLQGDDTEWFPRHLLQSIGQFAHSELLSRWTAPQLRVIARFISFMARHDANACTLPDDPNPWADALRAQWHSFLP